MLVGLASAGAGASVAGRSSDSSEHDQLLQRFVEDSDDLFVAVDHAGQISFVSSTARKVFGLEPEDCVGMLASEFIHREDVERTIEWFAGWIESGHPSATIEHRIVSRSGEVRDMLWTCNVYRGEDDAPRSITGIGRDITERNRVNARLDHNQRLEVVGTLAGGIAHDFNNILGSILGYTELALSHVPQDCPARESLDVVMQSVRRATDIVKQITDFGRVGDVERTPVDIPALVRDVMIFLRATIPSSTRIEQTLEPTAGVVISNSGQLRQVLVNLATNAYQSLDGRDGAIHIDVAGIDAPSGNGHVQITVRDEGCGMDEGTAARVFEPYFTTRVPFDGSGMGLAVVHGIVTRHGGTISLESELGVGTTVRVVLPRHDGPGADGVAVEPAPAEGTILFVDDEPLLVRLAKKLLERAGYSVVGFTDPVEALAAFAESPSAFDLVITDQTMPALTGLDLASKLLEVRPEMPIVVATGHSNLIYDGSLTAAGATAVLSKPYDQAQLAMVVRAALDS